MKTCCNLREISLILQAVIKLKGDGEYYVQNEGRRPVYIDGKPVVSGTKAKLQHNSTFEVIVIENEFVSRCKYLHCLR